MGYIHALSAVYVCASSLPIYLFFKKTIQVFHLDNTSLNSRSEVIGQIVIMLWKQEKKTDKDKTPLDIILKIIRAMKIYNLLSNKPLKI